MKNGTKIAAFTLVGLIGAGLAAAALAQGGPMPGGGHDRPSFEMLDANGDGAVTVDEVKAMQAARFAEHDANGDGLLSREEMIAAIVAEATARAEKMADRVFTWQDSDGDGLISPAEMPGNGMRFGRMFHRMDADGDGRVTEDEFQAVLDQMAERQDHRRGGRG